MVWFLLEERVKSAESCYVILPSQLDGSSVERKNKARVCQLRN